MRGAPKDWGCVKAAEVACGGRKSKSGAVSNKQKSVG